MIRQIAKVVLPESIKKKILNYLSKHYNKKVAKCFYNKNRYTYTPSQEKVRPDTEIGQFTSIANNCWIGPGNHPIDMLTTSPFFYAPYNEGKPEYNETLSEKIVNSNKSKKVIIGNDVWIGVNTTILQGVEIGDGAVIGANSLVTKDVQPYAVVGGVPAHVIKYRFSEDTIKKLLNVKWWNLSMKEINTLPFDDLDKCIKNVEYIRNNKRKGKTLFIVTSVITVSTKNLNYSKTRSIYSEEERLYQTSETLKSIRERVSNAEIWLVEGGTKNYEDLDWNGNCDRYIYAGSDKEVRRDVASRHKGIGEARMLLFVIEQIKKADAAFIVKISGRYCLNADFDISNFNFERFNFKNYSSDGSLYCGESKYRRGSHSTRLYGIPLNKISMWQSALKKSIFSMKYTQNGIENLLGKYLKGDVIFYQKLLGIEGNIAINGEKIKE